MKNLLTVATLFTLLSTASFADSSGDDGPSAGNDITKCNVLLEAVEYQVAGDDFKALAVAKKAIEAKSSNFTIVERIEEADLLMTITTIAGHYTLESDIKKNDGLVSQKLRKGAVATVQVFKATQNSEDSEFVTGVRAFEDQFFNNIKNSHERIKEAIQALPSCKNMLNQ